MQVLLAELATVEKEIIWLETKVEKLKKNLYKEKKLKKDRQMEPPRKYLERRLPYKQQNEGELKDLKWITITRSHNRQRSIEEGRFSLSSISDMQSASAKGW